MTDRRIVLRGGTVVTLDTAASVLRETDVLIDGDRIARIAPDIAAPGALEIDAHDAIVAPGLVDTHVHTWQYPMRAEMQRKWGQNYLRVYHRIRDGYTPQDTGDAALAAAYEMIAHGVTGAVDFLHGANATAEHVEAAVDAHLRAGTRTVVHSGTNTGVGHPDAEAARLRRLDELVALRSAPKLAGSRLLDLGLGLPTPSGETFDAVCEEIAFAREIGARMTFHQNMPGEIARLHERGLLGPDLVSGHSNAITDRELDAMAATGTVLSVTPGAEMLSGRSMTPTRRAVQRGVRVSFGVDTALFTPLDLRPELKTIFLAVAAHDGAELRDAVRMPIDAELDPPTLTFEGVLRAGSVGGAHGLGLGDRLGTVEPGALADLVVIRPRDPDGALADPAAYLVLGAPPAEQIETVLIGGVLRKRDGRLLGIEPEELREIDRRVRRNALALLRAA
ncbi:amidohydrolase family protein [Agromyces mediolanus]|uniref:amidohydrolase family protein n=1 Tax=Agromyces mediolanus TaxID=41986 RepID=UPI00203A6837|nr:amidohydrolase family protein [Agromyces mediolanus]MCM3657780.1 amidohydrolase family protein [Agromyces mediolanus]